MQRPDFTPELADLFARYSDLVSASDPLVSDVVDTYLEIAGEMGGQPVLDLKHTEQLVLILQGNDVSGEQRSALEHLCLKTLANVEHFGRDVPRPANVAPLAAYLAEQRSGGGDVDLSASEF